MALKYNTSNYARYQLAQKDNAAKLMLENTMYQKLQPVFSKYSSAFYKSYSVSASLPNSIDFIEDVKKTLLAQYNGISSKFSNQIVKALGNPSNLDSYKNRLNQLITQYQQTRALNSAVEMASTLQLDAQKAIDSTISTLGANTSQKLLAQNAQLLLDQRIPGRLVTGSITETQSVAEASKLYEMQALIDTNSQIDGEDVAASTKQKQWIALLDKYTRPTHAEVDGTIIDYDDVFTVDGEQMNYPKDMELGASIGNVVNCRCTAIYIIA